MTTDVLIAGGGLIGLTCALELRTRGLQVTVLERGSAAQEASFAAAGMLAAHDHAHPTALRPFAAWSAALYPALLQTVEEASGERVPIHTEWALERTDSPRDDAKDVLPGISPNAGPLTLIAEQSLNPRELGRAVYSAALKTGVKVLEGTSALQVEEVRSEVRVGTGSEDFTAAYFLDCTGAWCAPHVHPVKGQMFRVHAPGVLHAPKLGNVVIRTPEVYTVPRLDGSVVVGATVEQAGFDRVVHARNLDRLRTLAAALVPALADAPEVERWSGLRPGTPDMLPLLGRTGERTFVAAGHYRNGILLAPGTARLMAQVIAGEAPGVSMEAFDPQRFAPAAPSKGAFIAHVR